MDANLEKIAADAAERTAKDFTEFGFTLLDFRIEGASFDEETAKRIDGISNIQADVKAAQLAGCSFRNPAAMLAMREAARNENGQAAHLITALNMGQSSQQPAPAGPSVKDRLKALKELFDEGLLDEAEYKLKKQELMKEL